MLTQERLFGMPLNEFDQKRLNDGLNAIVILSLDPGTMPNIEGWANHC